MKKFMLFIACLGVTALLMSACGPTQECPAYGQVESSEVAVSQMA